ncbi:MAG: DUF1565 domain-containing protein, partial [Bacteroidales bacterium]|nr:DUF1565 domain-containing protein [Bacteroidales bacterium]
MKTITLLCFALLITAAMQAQIIYVYPNPDSLYHTIQSGINAATPGDTVLVAEGTYFEQINFLGIKPLMVASEFLMDNNSSHISMTIIDGSQLTNMDSASVVYFVSGEDTTSILCGFTIQNGQGTYNPDNGDYRNGGGIWISDAGAKIFHNRITHNILDDTQPVNGNGAGGAGIATPFEDADFCVIIEDNIIDSNTCISNSSSLQAYGGGIATFYNTRIVHNIISYNTCSGYSDAIAGSAGIDYERDPAWTNNNVAIIEHNAITHNLVQSQSNWAACAGVWIYGVKLSFSDNEVAYNKLISGNNAGVAVVGVFTPEPGSVISNNVFKGNVSNAWSGGLDLENYEILD